MGILLTMSLSLWKIVKRYTEKSNWEPQYYQKVRQIGFWAIALTLFNPVFEMGMFITIEPLSKYSTDFLLGRFLLSIVMESPGMWVLSLSIFLFAELLQVANQVKTENESFI